MQSLLKLFAYIAKSFGISSPSDNARAAASRKQNSARRAQLLPTRISLRSTINAERVSFYEPDPALAFALRECEHHRTRFQQSPGPV
jgi:hypothetical protein